MTLQQVPFPLSKNLLVATSKMTVTIRFRGPIANHITDGQLAIDSADGLLVRKVLELVIKEEKYVAEVWKSPEDVDRDALILLNGVDIGITGGLESTLGDGDVLVVLPLVHGG